jgi:hypothetical protein
MAFPNGWKRKQKITIDHTKLGGDETDFPVLLVWTGSASTSNVDPEIIYSPADTGVPNYSALSNGGDIRASSDSAGSIQLPVDVALIITGSDKTAARLEVHIKLASVSSVTNTTFYLWYDNANVTAPAVTDTYGRNAVWSANYLAVWHMTSSPGANEVDVTGNGNTAADNGSVPYATGLWNANSAKYLLGGSYYYIVTGLLTSPASLTMLGIGFSISLGAGTSGQMISLGDHVGMQLLTNSTLVSPFYAASGGWWQSTGVTDVSYSWFMMSYACSPAISHEIGYTNTTANTDTASSLGIDWAALGANTYIGMHANNGGTPFYWNGYVEELRVLSVYKAATWVTSSNNNLKSPQTFSLTAGGADAAPFPKGYTRKCKMTIDNTKLTGDLTNFPVLLLWNGTSGNLPSEIYNAGPHSPHADGHDIRATSDEFGRNMVPIDVAFFAPNSNIASAQVEIWVNLPTVSASTPTVFYLWWRSYFDSALSATDTNGRNAVWSPYVAVYHMNTAGNETDVTGDGNTAVNTSSTLTSGKITDAHLFTAASTQYMTVTPPPITTDFSVEFWVKTTTTAATNTGTAWYSGDGLVDAEVGGTTTDWGTSLLNNKVCFGIGNPDTTLQSVASVNDTNWHYVVATRVSSTGVVFLYVDNVSATATYATGARSAPPTLKFGAIQTLPAGYYLDGSMDEIRMSADVKTPQWVAANYNMQNSPSTFLSVGLIEHVQVVKLDQAAAIASAQTIAGGTISGSTTIGNGTSRALFVGVAYKHPNATPVLITSVTFNSVTMTLLANKVQSGGSSSNRSYLYWLPEYSLPAAGSYTCLVTFDNLTVPFDICVGYISLWNVNQNFAALRTGSNSASSTNTVTTTITSLQPDSWIIDVMSSGGGTIDGDTILSTSGTTAWVTNIGGGRNAAGGMAYTYDPVATDTGSSSWWWSANPERLVLVSTVVSPETYITTPYIMVGGTWSPVIRAFVMVSGVWQEFQTCKLKIIDQWT